MLSLRGFTPPWVGTEPSPWCGIAKTLVSLRLGLLLAGGLVLSLRRGAWEYLSFISTEINIFPLLYSSF